MRVLVFVCLIAAVAARISMEENLQDFTFDEYLKTFGKSYSDATDYALHEAQFFEKLAEIIRHNADKSQTWKMGVNQFTDMNMEEMKAMFGYNAKMADSRRASMPRAPQVHMAASQIPTSVDWRDKGCISPVKNQGGCGSCWAFGAVETIESFVQINTGKLPILSPQNVVSCAKNPQHCGGTGGCGGATAEIAFDWAKGGIASEQAYPYQARDTPCKDSVAKTAKVTGFVKLIENNYTDLIVNLAAVGPMAVNVDASPWSGYSSGVFTRCKFNEIDINHVVQVVGYGTDASGGDYWLIRNSWGASWGEKGYMRLQRHSDGDMKKWCGPDHRPQDGTGCDGGPPVVTVCGSCGIWYDTSYPTGAGPA